MWRTALLVLMPVFLIRTCGVRGQESPLAADEKSMQDAGLKTDGPALLDFFRKRTLSEADTAKLADTVRRLGDSSFAVREKATTDLITAGRNALPFLRPALKDPDLEIARRAEQCIQAIENGPGTALALAAARLLAARQPTGT